jgi:hypothetical protein
LRRASPWLLGGRRLTIVLVLSLALMLVIMTVLVRMIVVVR